MGNGASHCVKLIKGKWYHMVSYSLINIGSGNVYHLFGAIPYLNQWWLIVNLTPGNKILQNLNEMELLNPTRCPDPYAPLMILLVSNHLPPVCLSTFWKSTFKQQLGCRFDIMDCKSSFFCILTYAIVHVSIHHMIFRLYLYFLNSVLYYSCPNVFYRHSLYTF